MCFGKKLQSTVVIKKSKVQRSPLPLNSTSSSCCAISNIKVLYLRLYWWQPPPQKSCYCKFLCNNFIIAWWFLQKKVYWNKQGNKTMILSSVIQNCKIFFHPNSKRRPLDTKLCLDVSVVFLTKACIHSYYHGVSV